MIPQQHQWQMNQQPREEVVGADGMGKAKQEPDPNMVEGMPVQDGSQMGAAAQQMAPMQQQQMMMQPPQQYMMQQPAQ